MPTPKKKATTSSKGLPTTAYKGIKTVYGKYGQGSSVTTYEGSFGPKENIAGMKKRAKLLGEEKKDIAAAKRNSAKQAMKKMGKKK